MLALLLCLQAADEFRVDGPPFLPFGESAEFAAFAIPEGATLTWRLADAPGGIASAVRTSPAFSEQDFCIRGARTIRVTSLGTTEGDLRVSVALERRGARIGARNLTVRIGPVLRLEGRFRTVEHPRGGARGAAEAWTELVPEVNRIWKACGIEFAFSAGEAVKGRDSWFDGRGRFHPVIFRRGVRERSPAVNELLALHGPGRIDVFLVRECFMVRESRGLGDPVVEYNLAGWGIQEEGAAVDEDALAVDLAHELGHVLGLDDLGLNAWTPQDMIPAERRRLMCHIRKFREAPGFAVDEMKETREVARRILKVRSSNRK
ncbi:MAG: hypothetical protein HYY17_11725 [Planctomycetes bacterium]|nr:hypothetical protein [Planctomycetota bacterium]